MTSIPQFAATRVRSRQLILVSLDVMATAAARTEDSAAVFDEISSTTSSTLAE